MNNRLIGTGKLYFSSSFRIITPEEIPNKRNKISFNNEDSTDNDKEKIIRKGKLYRIICCFALLLKEESKSNITPNKHQDRMLETPNNSPKNPLYWLAISLKIPNGKNKKKILYLLTPLETKNTKETNGTKRNNKGRGTIKSPCEKIKLNPQSAYPKNRYQAILTSHFKLLSYN